jgi:hypothetical protein
MIGETQFLATARLDPDGNASVKVTAVTPYGKRTSSVSAEIADDKIVTAIGKSLQAAIEAASGDLQQQSVAAAAESLVVATRNKEKIT